MGARSGFSMLVAVLCSFSADVVCQLLVLIANCLCDVLTHDVCLWLQQRAQMLALHPTRSLRAFDSDSSAQEAGAPAALIMHQAIVPRTHPRALSDLP